MISRRNLITKSVAAMVVSVPYLQGCLAKKPSDESLIEGEPLVAIDWSEFIRLLDEIAQTQFSLEWDQEAYVQDVITLMRLLQLDEAEFASLYDGYVDSLGKFPEIDTAHDGVYFEVVTLEFKEGSEIGLHNHPDMTGVILCLSGEITIESYNLLEDLSDAGNLLIEQLEKTTLTAGDFATLTANRGNIHSLQTSQYAALLDVFTPPYDEERLQKYRSYERSTEPLQDNVFEAWEV
jgi:hypothetical protein